jgi:class 3 adenylate cyclase
MSVGMAQPESQPKVSDAVELSEPVRAALNEVVGQLACQRWAAELFDPRWRLVWLSDELKAGLGEARDAELGVGEHIASRFQYDAWRGTLSVEGWKEIYRLQAPYWMSATDHADAELGTAVPEEMRSALHGVDPMPAPAVWTWRLAFRERGLRPLPVSAVSVSLKEPELGHFGFLVVYGPAIRSGLVAMLVRGDEQMFERMAQLQQPARQQAAILFADLDSSATLSRRLASEAYFELIRKLTTRIDGAVADHRGIVGKHVGDGVTAFFLAGDCGSESAAARAAIETAKRISDIAAEIRDEAPSDSALARVRCLFNIGLHWGANVYIGQVVTGGRLEITALGDEVNEAARIEQAARDGQLLASKVLLEQLDCDDRGALRIDVSQRGFQSLGETPGIDEKVARDAGTLAVTPVEF